MLTEFVISKINEDNNNKIRPLLNEILENVDPIDDESSIHYQRIIQYIILINYMGDPTSLTCVQETTGGYYYIV